MQAYTLVFIFNKSHDKVILIKKTHPKAQAGKFNGVGGKLENAEPWNVGAVREVLEEISIVLPISDLHYVGTITDKHINLNTKKIVKPPTYKVVCSFIIINEFTDSIINTTEEIAKWYPVNKLPVQLCEHTDKLIKSSLSCIKEWKL